MAWVPALAERIYLIDGARRAGLAFLAGAVGALAMAPIGFFPALVIPMSLAVWLIDGCGLPSGRKLASLAQRALSAAKAGWFLGFGYFVAGLHWLGAAFFVEPDKFAWAAPLGVLGLPAVLALFTALGFAIAAFLWRPDGRRVFALAFGLGLSELARGVLFTGFPWNGFGMALGGNLVLAQIASVIGLYGLNVAAVFLAAAPATLADPAPQSLVRSTIGLATASFLAIGAFGFVRLANDKINMAPNVRLRIMQPNIPQDEKFKPAKGMELLRAYLALSDRSTSPTSPGLSNVTHLIWPESPLPFVLAREPQALSAIASALAGRVTLLTGAIRVDGAGAGAKAYNSLLVVDSGGRIIEGYDKTHLTPFGEYLPFEGFFRAIGLTQMIALPGGFSAGALKRVLTAPMLPSFQPVICYEAIFPIEILGPNAVGPTRPEFFLNVTNDAWFGRSAGPHQHLSQSRLRAIEMGLPLIRAANSGISAVIDPYGRILQSLPVGVAGVLDSPLPKPIPPTQFALYSRIMTSGVLLVALVFSFLGRRMR